MTSGSSFNVNTFDAIVLGVLGLSSMVAFFRGFIRELLSLGAWVGAALVTLYLFPHSTEFMQNHIHTKGNTPIAAGAGALGTYIAALFAFSLFNSIVLRYVKSGAEVGVLDNFLGLIFGALRGAFIISLGYLIMSAVVNPNKNNTPSWLQNSVTRSYVESGANLLANAAPKYLSDIEGFIKKEENKAKQDRAGNGMDSSGGDSDNPDAPKSFNQILNQRYPQQQGTQPDTGNGTGTGNDNNTN